MASKRDTSIAGTAARTRHARRRRSASPPMSEKHTQAYLMAREVLRRIRRPNDAKPAD